MTEIDYGICDVCGVQPAIGVASTSLPMSVAYCMGCAGRGADPEGVLIHLLWTCGGPDGMADLARQSLNTFKDGRYWTFDEWYVEYGIKIDLDAMDREFAEAIKFIDDKYATEAAPEQPA